MAKGYKHGAGGTNPLNFKVVGNPQPSNPKENTIWVDTDVPITGWEFSANEPLIGEIELDTSIDISGYYIKSTGQQTASDSFNIAIIDIPEQVTALTVKLSGNTASSVYHAFYDASGTLISTVQRKVGTATIEVPSGAKIIRMSFRINDNPSVKCVSTAQDGMVHFMIGTSSSTPFNALKKNGLQVYPLSAKQYVSGAWVDKTAKSYQGGRWVDWITYLYNMGDECAKITGGWKHLATSGYASNAQNTAEGLYDKKTSQKGAYPSNWYTNNMIDVTDISVIHAKILATVAIDAWVRLIITRNNTDLVNEYLAWVNVQYTNAGEILQLDLDVSAFSGNYYIKLNHQGGSNAEVFWKEVWYE